MSIRQLSSRFLMQFVETAANELGHESLSLVMNKAGLASDWTEPVQWSSLNGRSAAEAYAGLQKAMRTYFGRGARGILIRVGSSLWQRLLEDASLAVKAQSRIVFGLPVNARRKPALELLAKLLADRRGDVTVHTLDLDLLLVDKASPGTLGQSEPEHICYVTLGLLRECLHWATGQEHDIEETSCRANGDEACEFKIIIGQQGK
jgi:predicted hydrocarbon binding protein